MKIALVNLCKIEDVSLNPSFKNDLAFLSENKIEYVDYVSRKKTATELLDGFHDALKDNSVEVVWFTQGGSTLINFIDLIDWELVVSSGKKFVGLSDFTHFSAIAVSKGVQCYYGLALKNIKKYYSGEKILHVSNFLKSISKQGISLTDNNYYSVADTKITGGHLTSFIFMVDRYNINLKEKALFIEHHYIPGETFDDLAYYIDQLILIIKENPPKSIILGHTILFNDLGQEVDYRDVNKFISERISKLNLPITEVDHFVKPIIFG